MTVYEKSAAGRRGFIPEPCDVPAAALGAIVGEENLRKTPAALPEMSEIDTVRHYTALAKKNFGVDTGFYPLGSCTMKYNPKINEQLASLPGFLSAHPFAPDEMNRGCLRLMAELERMLCAICGMEAFSLQPAAGAHGELTGLMCMAAYFAKQGQSHRNVILIPDSAHGTNPASAAQAGFSVRAVPSGRDGLVDPATLREAAEAAGGALVGLMLTNPNTLGLFEKNIMEVAGIIHGAGGLLYYDGANLNAVMGVTSPGAMGFDVMHLNLHKTFSAPHGGGGPGAGPVGAGKLLAPFLPGGGQDSIGRVRAYRGSFGVLVRAYCYIRALGASGLREASESAVLNANWLLNRLSGAYDAPYGERCMHEFVLSAAAMKEQTGVSAMDIAKGLIDKGFHPPTVYFPTIVPESLMTEPTETESPETLEAFAAAMLSLAEDAKRNPEALHSAPVTTPVGRLDATAAARQPIIKSR
ncbi:MAG: aminomethyl-transferring glycine dehydrogenase subunit GcvPB [Oscillospiraceae bacterium]|jgi:glycine dehydrogenase subunit 2|nr:aminomethyl-transferring glycine dehydrogenase subunit GcvPB [Oscillospiraceae bacterium]